MSLVKQVEADRVAAGKIFQVLHKENEQIEIDLKVIADKLGIKMKVGVFTPATGEVRGVKKEVTER